MEVVCQKIHRPLLRCYILDWYEAKYGKRKNVSDSHISY